MVLTLASRLVTQCNLSYSAWYQFSLENMKLAINMFCGWGQMMNKIARNGMSPDLETKKITI